MRLDYGKIGDRVRMRRKCCGLTQEQLAELINRAPSFVGHIERGTRIMSLETLYALVLALECSADELLGFNLFQGDQYAAARQLLELARKLTDVRAE